jgi:hypothetical protein
MQSEAPGPSLTGDLYQRTFLLASIVNILAGFGRPGNHRRPARIKRRHPKRLAHKQKREPRYHREPPFSESNQVLVLRLRFPQAQEAAGQKLPGVAA